MGTKSLSMLGTSSDWDDVTQGLGEELIIAQPRPTDEILGGHWPVSRKTACCSKIGARRNAQPIHLPVPVLLNVRRYIENVAADLVDIRELDEELKVRHSCSSAGRRCGPPQLHVQHRN